MQTVVIELKTKAIDIKALEGILRRVLREAEKEGLKGAIKNSKITIAPKS